MKWKIVLILGMALILSSTVMAQFPTYQSFLELQKQIGQVNSSIACIVLYSSLHLK
jgi:hypothetical protein